MGVGGWVVVGKDIGQLGEARGEESMTLEKTSVIVYSHANGSLRLSLLGQSTVFISTLTCSQ